MSNDMPTIGPKGGAGNSRNSEPVSNAQSLKALGFVIVLCTVGIPLTILLWKVALTWTP